MDNSRIIESLGVQYLINKNKSKLLCTEQTSITRNQPSYVTTQVHESTLSQSFKYFVDTVAECKSIATHPDEFLKYLQDHLGAFLHEFNDYHCGKKD